MGNNDKIRQQICILHFRRKHMVLTNSTSHGGVATNGDRKRASSADWYIGNW